MGSAIDELSSKDFGDADDIDDDDLQEEVDEKACYDRMNSIASYVKQPTLKPKAHERLNTTTTELTMVA
jgi:hypothetical protein